MKAKDSKINILLIGCGAVGSYYCGKLNQVPGVEMTVLCRSDYDLVKEKGIEVKSFLGDFKFMPHEVINNLSNYKKSPDYIIIATKVLQDSNIPLLIKDVVAPCSTIVLIQNGINIEGEYAKAFPENEIISCLAFIGVCRTGPGKVEHQESGFIDLGLYPAGSLEKAEHLARLFTEVGVKVRNTEKIQFFRWKKLLWNLPYNTISVVGGRLTTKDMTGSEMMNTLIRNIMQEVFFLAHSSGYHLPSSFIDENIEVTSKMGAYKTSMLLDFENKRPLEVEAIVGNAVKIAEELKVNVPLIKALYPILLSVDKKNRME